MANLSPARRHLVFVGVRAFVLVALVIAMRVASPSAAAGTFVADFGTLGAIPDGTSLSLPAYGAPRNVTVTVAGLPGTVTNVVVSFAASHTFVGDLEVTLTAPDGSHTLPLFARTGATSSSSFGSGADLLSTNAYTFDDAATTNWWTRVGTNTTVPAGSNRTVVANFDASPPPDVTSLNAAFAGAAPNGTWTLRFRDGSSADTGAVAAVALTLTTSGIVGPAAVDLDGNHQTDYVVTRHTGAGTPLIWYTNNSAGFSAIPWGIAGDHAEPAGDFDGDGKTDIAVWREGSPAYFYVRRSSNGVLIAQQWGSPGDNPKVAADYDGDGLTDFAVYRQGASAGATSTWFVLRSSNGTVLAQPWGLLGDFAAPGDFDGDGKGDFTVQRSTGGGGATFFQMLSTAGFRATVFGTPTDVIVPGDYDGDGKADIAVFRSGFWYVLRSSDGAITATQWGAAGTDFSVQGDYDGDGKTDLAVWRSSPTPGVSGFWVLRSSGGFSFFQWGQAGDYPAANFNSH